MTTSSKSCGLPLYMVFLYIVTFELEEAVFY